MENITFRRATEEDAFQVWEVRTAAISVLCASHYSTDIVDAWAGVKIHESFRPLIREVPFFVGQIKDQIVGCGFLDPDRARVEGMFVRPRFARRGIASSILKLVEAAARAKGLPRLELDATLSAVAFYEHHEYAPVAPGQWRHPEGFDIACVHMQKNL